MERAFNSMGARKLLDSLPSTLSFKWGSAEGKPEDSTFAVRPELAHDSMVRDLRGRNCTWHHAGNGLFVWMYGAGMPAMSREVLMQRDALLGVTHSATAACVCDCCQQDTSHGIRMVQQNGPSIHARTMCAATTSSWRRAPAALDTLLCSYHVDAHPQCPVGVGPHASAGAGAVTFWCRRLMAASGATDHRSEDALPVHYL